MTDDTANSVSLARRMGATILVSSALSIFVLGPLLAAIALPLYLADEANPPAWASFYRQAWFVLSYVSVFVLVVFVWKRRIGLNQTRNRKNPTMDSTLSSESALSDDKVNPDVRIIGE